MNTERPSTTAVARLAEAQLTATACVALLTTATAISMCRVFPDWGYLRPMLVVVLGTHLAAAALRFAHAPLFVALPLALFAIVELMGFVFYRSSLVNGLTGSHTIDLMRDDLRLVLDQFPTAISPVPSSGIWAAAATAALAVCAAMSDTFAFRAMGRLETVAPSGVVFVFTAALGTERHRVAAAALWVGSALLVVAVLRFRSTSEETAWMGARKLRMIAALPPIVLTTGVAAVIAGALGPRLPGAGADALYDTRNRHGSVTEIISPLVDIGSQLRDQGRRELFTVESNDGGHYWRLTGLPVFNGRTWELGDEDLVAMGDRAGENSVPGVTGRETITIAALGGNLVPTGYRPVRVSPDDIVYAPISQSLVLPDTELRRGDIIAIDAEMIRPSVEHLRSAGVAGADPRYLELPDGLPSVVTETAQGVAGGATTAYDKAIALQSWFRSNFAYDTEVNYGNDQNAIADFIAARKGFCQQFAGTFAVMARTLGLPTRVAVGFTSGELRDDGLYHVYGRHAHAWPEVWFAELGWVAFEPTPGRGNGDTTAYTGVEGQQVAGGDTDPTGTNPGGSTATTDDVIGTAPEVDSTAGGGTGRTTTTIAAGASRGGGGGSSLPWVFIGVLCLLIVWVVAAPRVVRAIAHRHDETAADRVVTAWRRTLGVLALAGAPAIRGATPLEYAHIAQEATGIDHRALREIARHVTTAVYSPAVLDDATAERCDLLAHEIDVQCRDRIPAATRAQALFDLRLMRRRYAG